MRPEDTPDILTQHVDGPDLDVVPPQFDLISRVPPLRLRWYHWIPVVGTVIYLIQDNRRTEAE